MLGIYNYIHKTNIDSRVYIVVFYYVAVVVFIIIITAAAAAAELVHTTCCDNDRELPYEGRKTVSSKSYTFSNKPLQYPEFIPLPPVTLFYCPNSAICSDVFKLCFHYLHKSCSVELNVKMALKDDLVLFRGRYQ
jgi:hypothetical protein